MKACNDSGVSLLEVLLAVVIFVLAFIPLLRLFSETGLSQQRIVRDFPVAISIAERILTTIENEIVEGTFDAENFRGDGISGVDITSSITENQEVSMALENFYGKDNQSATKFINKCRVTLQTLPNSNPNLIEVKVKFLWNDQNSANKEFKHSIELCLLKNKG